MNTTYSAFAGDKLVAEGPLQTILPRVKKLVDELGSPTVLVFEDETGKQVDFDLRGEADEVVARYAPVESRIGPGRPKLGVVSREVSLLPKHWEWLELSSHGISGALRRLVDHAMKHEPPSERARRAREAMGKVMWAVAGNLVGFEEASRALHASDHPAFKRLIRSWPKDIRGHLLKMLAKSAALDDVRLADGPEEAGDHHPHTKTDRDEA